MPKDTEKYQYFTFGLLRGSWALQKFLNDAERHHVLDQPGKLAGIRLTEYYELTEKGAIMTGAIPAMTPMPPGGVATNGATNGTEQTTTTISSTRRGGRSSKAVEPPPAVATDEEAMMGLSGDPDENADAALSFFMDEDEEEAS